jgi:hypothetical protein
MTSALLFSNAFKIAFALSIFEILFIVLSRAQEALFSIFCSVAQELFTVFSEFFVYKKVKLNLKLFKLLIFFYS